MHTLAKTNPPFSNNDIMSNTNQIVATLADLELQVFSNYSVTTKKHKVICTTLIKRYIGKTVLNYEATIEHQQTLNTI